MFPWMKRQHCVRDTSSETFTDVSWLRCHHFVLNVFSDTWVGVLVNEALLLRQKHTIRYRSFVTLGRDKLEDISLVPLLNAIVRNALTDCAVYCEMKLHLFCITPDLILRSYLPSVYTSGSDADD